MLVKPHNIKLQEGLYGCYQVLTCEQTDRQKYGGVISHAYHFFVAATRSKIKTGALSIAFKKIPVEFLSNAYSGCTTRKLVKKSHTEI